jgi:hypothetical protein
MSPRDSEITELAAEVAVTYSSENRVSPVKILKEKKIPLVVGHYGDAFDGLLECVNGRFFVHCNLDRENAPESARGRFTIAHELGHYFIDEHRNSLASGKVKPHGSFADKPIADLQVEREANLFASFLLMPQNRFSQVIKGQKPGLAVIEKVAQEFDVSFTCAAIRFASHEVFPCAVFKWSDDGFAWKWCSRTFWEAGFRKSIEDSGRIPEDSATGECMAKASGKAQSTTTASFWFPWVNSGSQKDVLLREEAVSLGRFGVLTILSLLDGQKVVVAGDQRH